MLIVSIRFLKRKYTRHNPYFFFQWIKSCFFEWAKSSKIKFKNCFFCEIYFYQYFFHRDMKS